jgi:nitroreductase
MESVKSMSNQLSWADNIDHLIRYRRSTRAFLARPVQPELLRQIFDLAGCAASNCNTQPWLTHVVSGASRDAMSDALMQSVGQGKYSLDFPYDGKYEGIYRQRQVDVGVMLYQALGIARQDKEAKRQAFLRNLEFFGAPHVAFIFLPEWADMREAADVGLYAQNLMLAMQAHGIASCSQTILGYNADVVREQLAIESNQKLLFGISFGYADETRPENKICPARAKLLEVTSFYD